MGLVDRACDRFFEMAQERWREQGFNADIVDILDKYREETNKVIRRNKVSVITTFLIQLYGYNHIELQKDITKIILLEPSGEKMYIDWVGDQPGLLTDVTTGEIMRVHIFATTLGVSSMIYAEAFPNEKLPCFIEGCVHAVSFYGAVAKHFVPDNLKTAVTKHTKDDLVLQSTFSDLEDFYDTIVLPPPARKPKGKPTVENHVRYLETHLIETLFNILGDDKTISLCYRQEGELSDSEIIANLAQNDKNRKGKP